MGWFFISLDLPYCLLTDKQKFSCLWRFVFLCYTSLKFHSTAVTYYIHAPLYRKISPRLLVARSRCEQSEAKNKKFPCLNGLNLFVLSSGENFFVTFKIITRYFALMFWSPKVKPSLRKF